MHQGNNSKVVVLLWCTLLSISMLGSWTGFCHSAESGINAPDDVTLFLPNYGDTVKTGIWDEKRLNEAFELADAMGSSTLILVTNGEVIKSMGDIETPHDVHSVRKALLSALVGQHAGHGPNQINLENTLAELEIDDDPSPLNELQKQAKVIDLIRSVSGINHAAAGEGLGEVDLMAREKDKRLGDRPNRPGTIWAYNNWDYNTLTTIFEQQTGKTI